MIDWIKDEQIQHMLEYAQYGIDAANEQLEIIMDEYWANWKSRNRELPYAERGTVAPRKLRRTEFVEVQWMRFVGKTTFSTEGGDKAQGKYIKKGKIDGYTRKTFTKFAKDWELDMIEGALEEVSEQFARRKEFTDLRKGLRLVSELQQKCMSNE